MSLYNGLDLRGWHTENQGSWSAEDWKLVCKAEAGKGQILTEKEYSNFRLIIDWRLSGTLTAKQVPVILDDGNQAVDDEGNKIMIPVRDAGNARILLRGTGETAVELTCWPHGSGSILDNGKRIAVPVIPNDEPPGAWNRFEISVLDNRVNIKVNEKMIISDFYLDSAKEKGRIGLQYEGFPVEFANIYMLEL
jgi:hypothetical protein